MVCLITQTMLGNFGVGRCLSAGLFFFFLMFFSVEGVKLSERQKEEEEEEESSSISRMTRSHSLDSSG